MAGLRGLKLVVGVQLGGVRVSGAAVLLLAGLRMLGVRGPRRSWWRTLGEAGASNHRQDSQPVSTGWTYRCE